MLENYPLQNSPPYERLADDLVGIYSRGITIQHRIIYQVYENEIVTRVILLWTHNE